MLGPRAKRNLFITTRNRTTFRFLIIADQGALPPLGGASYRPAVILGRLVTRNKPMEVVSTYHRTQTRNPGYIPGSTGTK
jgi:hypothetical protein